VEGTATKDKHDRSLVERYNSINKSNDNRSIDNRSIDNNFRYVDSSRLKKNVISEFNVK